MNMHEIEFLRAFGSAIAQFNSARDALQSLKTTQHHTHEQSALTLSLVGARFSVTSEQAGDKMALILKEEASQREKRLMIERLPPYFEASCRSQIHRCLSTIDGWVTYLPKFRTWWRSAAEAHNHGRTNKVSDLREKEDPRFQLGAYDLELFDFDYGSAHARYFLQLSYNPDRGYLCMTLNDSHNPVFWWNFIMNTGPADDVNAHNSIAECLETLEGFST